LLPPFHVAMRIFHADRAGVQIDVRQHGLIAVEVVRIEKLLLVTDFGEGTGCPGELSGGSVILTASAIIPRDHPEGGRHAGS
jgi:hypothetical protein